MVQRRISALVIAGVLAMVCAAALVLYVNGANRRAVQGQEAGQVWVTTAAVPRGTSLADAKKSLRLEAVPVRSVPESASKDLPTDPKAVAQSDIAKGEVLLSGRFVSPKDLGPELLTIPADHMATSVSLADQNRVSSFVQPGDFVAVFASIKVGADSSKNRGFVLFPRVQVLGVGAKSENGTVEGNGKAKSEVTMTLALTSDQTSLLTSALSSDAYLQFALLPADASAKVSGSLQALLGAKS